MPNPANPAEAKFYPPPKKRGGYWHLHYEIEHGLVYTAVFPTESLAHRFAESYKMEALLREYETDAPECFCDMSDDGMEVGAICFNCRTRRLLSRLDAPSKGEGVGDAD